MADIQTGKQRARRVALDYFRTRSWIDRSKSLLSWMAVILSSLFGIGMVAGFLSANPGFQKPYSRGDLASVHASWNDNCNACHEPFKPIAAEAQWLGSLLGSHGSEMTVKCENCHRGSGDAGHHEKRLAKDAHAEACTSCHRDHRGSEISLVAVGDRHCTNCHANLNTFVAEKTALDAKVTGFRKDGHPEFAILREGEDKKAKTDPGNLKFNHATHMRAGLAQSADPSRRPMTYAQLATDAERDRYKRLTSAKDDTAPIQLTCAACHVTDLGDNGLTGPGNGISAALLGSGGRAEMMLPIVYDLHCKACHKLQFDPNYSDAEIPHGLQPPQVTQFLFGFYASKPLDELKKNSEAAAAEGGGKKRVFPGRNLKPTGNAAEDETREQVEKATQAAATILLVEKDLADRASKLVYPGKRMCNECHHYDPADADGIEKLPTKILAPNVPTVWFSGAKFSHLAHRAVDCKSCHAQAYPTADSKSFVDTSDEIMLPGVASCMECHAPATAGKGGAGFDCIECHRYHTGESGAQSATGPVFDVLGGGAKAFAPQKQLSILEYFQGMTKGKPQKPAPAEPKE